MLKGIARIIVFLAVFIAGVIFFSTRLKQGVTVSASDLSDPTLPVMCIDVDGYKADTMFGYRDKMDALALRDALIPISTDHLLSVSYKANDTEVHSVAYEIYAPDTGEVIENAKIGGFREDGEYWTATLSMETPILMNREYPVRFTLNTSQGDLYYYGRLLQRANPQTVQYVKFVYDFYETCLNKGGATRLNAYLETDETIKNTSFNTVNIKSTLDQVTWGSLNPQMLRRAVPRIHEINNTTCSLTTDYLILAMSEEEKREVYRVKEFYRLRYYNGQMMLLNFERNAEQVFDPEQSVVVSTDGIELGVASRDVTYKSNDAGRILAFVQDNTLWSFNTSSQKLTKVFTFHNDTETGDERCDHNDYAIRIIRVRDSGDIDFTVYGYMNRGHFEGMQGILIAGFSGEGGYVEERAFIPCEGSFDYLEEMQGTISYLNGSGQYFTYLNRSIYQIDLTTMSPTVVLSDIHPDCFVSSGDGRTIAWMEGMDPEKTTKIVMRDLESGTSRTIEAEEGSYLKTLGFINRDLIYGIADENDLRTLPQGETLFAMNTLKIEDADGAVIKEYRQDGYWINGITIQSGLIELHRMTADGNGGYKEAQTDNIMNNRQGSEDAVTVKTSNTQRRGMVVTLVMPQTVRNLLPNIEEARVRSVQGGGKVNFHVPFEREMPLYRVYAYGKLQGIFTDPGEAVQSADAQVGVVLNEEGQYIYERGTTDSEYEILNEDLLEAVTTPSLNVKELAERLGDEATVLDLTGCTLEQVLYEVGRGRAVLARAGDGSVNLIVGFNRYNTRLYDFETGEHYWYGIMDSTALFEEGGNIFVSYVEPDRTVR